MTKAFQYIKENGISTYTSYPYHPIKRICTRSAHPRTSVKVTNFINVQANERSLEAAVGKFDEIFTIIMTNKIQIIWRLTKSVENEILETFTLPS